MNKIILIGNLGHDPSAKDVNGKNCVSFSLGVPQGYGDKKTTIWFNCSAWEKTADICKQYLSKGSKVFILGELTPPRVYADRQGNNQVGLNVTIRDLQMLTPKGEQQQSRQPSDSGFNSDDVPF